MISILQKNLFLNTYRGNGILDWQKGGGIMNEWDKRFKISDYAYGKEANYFIRKIHDQLHYKGQILAIAEGEGEGRNAIFLAEKGFDVTTWDYSEEGIKKQKP